MDIKCRCGRYARINMGMEWVCWECRAEDLNETHLEDWRDYTLRAKTKELGLELRQGETPQQLTERCRPMFKILAQGLGEKVANSTRK